MVEAKKHLESNDAETLKKASDDLTAVSMQMATHIYKQNEPAAEAAAGTSEQQSSQKQEDVIDADYKEV